MQLDARVDDAASSEEPSSGATDEARMSSSERRRHVSRPHLVGAMASFTVALAMAAWAVTDDSAAPRTALALVVLPVALGMALVRSAIRRVCAHCRGAMRGAFTVEGARGDGAHDAVETRRLDALREVFREDGLESHIVAVERCARCGARVSWRRA
jgi:hypothetical protein